MGLSRVLAVALLLLVTSCQRDGGIIGHVRLSGVTGTFVLEDDDRTTPLTFVQHSVFYQVGDKRKLVFKGSGGDHPRLSMIGLDTILLRYCRGSVYKIDSSFWDRPNGGEDMRILRFQVVTEPGLSIKGRSIC